MFCQSCGNEISERALYCRYCGVKMISDSIDEDMKNSTEEEKRQKVSISPKKVIISVAIIVVIISSVISGILFIQRKSFQNELNMALNTEYALGEYEEEYAALLEESIQILKKNKFLKMDAQKDKIVDLKNKVYQYNVELKDEYRELEKEFLDFENTYILGQYEEAYRNIIEQVSSLNEEEDYRRMEALSKEMKELKSGIQEMNVHVAEYKEMLETAKKEFYNLYMNTSQKEECERLCSGLSEMLQIYNISECEKYASDLDSYKNSIINENKNLITEIENTLENADTEILFDTERKMLAHMENEAKNAFNQGDYRNAYEKYLDCERIIATAEKSEQYSMNLEQVDVSEYPNVNLYISVKDFVNDSYVEGLNGTKFSLMESTDNGTKWEKTNILKAVQMDGQEGLSVGLVADCSGSMEDNFYYAQELMSDFINNLQVASGDMAAIYAFSDFVTRAQHFTSDINQLDEAVWNLDMGNMTALYDALAFSLSEIVVKDGAKCIIAFTDGMENYSNSSKEYVISKAQEYNIPIYLIGIGEEVDDTALYDIAIETGGFYENIEDVSYMGEVYERIYREQKSMYVVQYTTNNKIKEDTGRLIYVNYMDDNYGIRMEGAYTPTDYKINKFIFWDSDLRYITEEELDELTEAEIRIARNEIYARRGYIFTKEDMIEHFNNCQWYVGTEINMEVVAQQFNEYEKKNIDTLINYEAKHNLNGILQ